MKMFLKIFIIRFMRPANAVVKDVLALVRWLRTIFEGDLIAEVYQYHKEIGKKMITSRYKINNF